MEITDLKLLESERMTDFSDGGGRMTNREIVSGLLGNVWPKISRLDSVNGRDNFRKMYVAVQTATTEMAGGVHTIVSHPPADPLVNVVLFKTGSAFDTRAQAQDWVERWVVRGPQSRMVLYGTQFEGQASITVYQRVEEPIPEIATVLCLSTEAAGYVANEQFVRVSDILRNEIRSFTYQIGSGEQTFQRRLLTLRLEAKLRHEFPGPETVTPFQVNAAGSVNQGTFTPTLVRETSVQDATRYFGIAPLAEAATAGSYSVLMESVYTQIVPTATRETAVSLAQIAGVNRLAAAGTVARYAIGSFDQTTINTTLFLGRAILPGSLVIDAGPNLGGASSTDDGRGALPDNAFFGGEINYEGGSITLHSVPSGWTATVPIYVAFTAAAPVAGPAHTHNIPVTLATQGTVYAITLNPLPAPGTVRLAYRAMGQWYELRDETAGQLAGNAPGYGSGNLSYVDGSLTATLGALPDLDSDIVVSWGSPAHYVIRAGGTSTAAAALRLAYTLAHTPVVPGTHVASYPVGGVERTTTDTDGVISGTGVSGTLNYATGEVVLDFTVLPDRTASVSNAYTWRDGEDVIGSSTEGIAVVGGELDLSAFAPFRGAGRLRLNLADGSQADGYLGTGGTVFVSRGVTQAGRHFGSQNVGVYNATTGIVTITNGVTWLGNTWSTSAQAWNNDTGTVAITGAWDVRVERDTVSWDPNAVTGEAVVVAGNLQLDLTTTVADTVVPGSTLARLTGKTYLDRNGTLYTDMDPATGSAVVAGTINYASGVCALSYWADGAALGLAVDACLTAYGEPAAIAVAFRTAGSPLRAASTYVQVTTEDGRLLSAVSDQDGVFAAPEIAGEIRDAMGVASLAFGQMIEAVWVPTRVLLSTLRYSTVVRTAVPLDVAIVGIDNARLPVDGRVPIVRTGDTAVIHHTDETALPNPAVAGATYALPRGNLAVVTVLDADGEEVPATEWIADLAAGSVTMSATLDLTGHAQPLTARHRIEDMCQIAAVQINGLISVSAPLSHDYPAGAFVSSALPHGDLQAGVESLFDQATWTGVWSEALQGGEATAQYNDIDYPVVVTNAGAVPDRWRISFLAARTTGTNGSVQVIGEQTGILGTWTLDAPLAPINPRTGLPYFTIPLGGWGVGWSAGNQVRFNTRGANASFWALRGVMQGASLGGDSSQRFENRADVD